MPGGLSCPVHPSTQLVEDSRAGDLICPDCGLVVGERIVNVSAEWRSFTTEYGQSDPSRVGAPENHLLAGADLTTLIALDFNSNEIDKRMATVQNRTMSAADRQMMAAMKHIKDMCDRGNLPKSIEGSAAHTFKQVKESGALKGKNLEAQASACLYIACRQRGVPRTFKEICAISSVSKSRIGACFKKIIRLLEANLEQVTSADFMSRFCDNLDLPMAVQMCAVHIAKMARELDLVAGRSPVSVAAAAIYMASQASPRKKTTKEVAEIAGAAEATLRSTYKSLVPEATKLFPEGFKCSTPLYSLPSS